MNLDGALQTFFAEAEELLQAMESGLLSMEEGNTDAETLNAVFRAAHTIKGSAGLFGLDNIVSFTHILENVLDRVRDGKVEINSALLSALLPCRDHIATLVDDVMNQRDTEATCLAKGKELLAALEPWLDDSIKQNQPQPHHREMPPKQHRHLIKVPGIFLCAWVRICCATEWTRYQSCVTSAPWATSRISPP